MIKRVLEQTSLELSSDIVDRGIVLTGGGSLLKVMDQVLRETTDLAVSVSEQRLLPAVSGQDRR